MKRRDTLKALSLSSLGLAAMPSTELVDKPQVPTIAPGRVLDEAATDKKLFAEKYFTDAEKLLLKTLADIIVPAEGKFPAASKVGVVEFIEFMAKDKKELQTPLRGGLKWVNRESLKRFSTDFVKSTTKQQIEIVEDIAYPNDGKPEHSQGTAFFTQLRGLVLTGYFTTKEGVEDLGYMGNVPNMWEGVPADVLEKYGLTNE